MSQIENLKIRLGIRKEDISKDDLLNLLLEDSKNEILDHCNRSVIPVRVEALQRELAVIYYNRQGSEGESSRSEGGVSVSYSLDIPESIKARLSSFRLLKGVSRANENKES